MVIYSGFSHWKLWFSIATLNYQRVDGFIGLRWLNHGDDDDDHDPHNLHKISIAPRTSPNQSSINRSLAAFAQLSPLG